MVNLIIRNEKKAVSRPLFFTQTFLIRYFFLPEELLRNLLENFLIRSKFSHEKIIKPVDGEYSNSRDVRAGAYDINSKITVTKVTDGPVTCLKPRLTVLTKFLRFFVPP